MAKVILVDPRGWQGYASGGPAYPNIGIAYLISALREHGHETQIIDLNNSGITDTDLVSTIRAAAPDIVGFSAKTATIRSATESARQIKEELPHITTVAGGPHVTLAYREMVKRSVFDILVVGEAEETFITLCDQIDNGQDPGAVPGVVNCGNGTQGSEVEIAKVIDLNKIPFPDYDPFPPPVRERLKTEFPLLTCRGCPFKCTFCSVPLVSGRKFRVRSFDNIFQELNLAMDRYGVRGFEIIDDIFNLNVARSVEFCRKLIDAGLNLTWSCPNGLRADLMTVELAELMAKAGCVRVAIGVESADPKVFATIKKGESLEEIEEGIKILNDVGIEVTGFFIIGLPGDSLKSVERSIAFAAKNKIQPVFNMLVPYPGTELYRWASREARFLVDIEEGVHFSPNIKEKVVIETDSFSEKDRVEAWELAHFRTASLRMMSAWKGPLALRPLKFLVMSWKYNLFKALILPFFRDKIKKRARGLLRRAGLRW